MYHANGWAQINAQRYALDFLPILMLLTVRGLPYANRKLWEGCVIYSVALNVIALLVFLRLWLVLFEHGNCGSIIVLSKLNLTKKIISWL